MFAWARRFKFPTVTLHYDEQFTFCTDKRKETVIIDKADPRKLQYIKRGFFPYHIGFGRIIVPNNSGIHEWQLMYTNTSKRKVSSHAPTAIVMGIYWGDFRSNLKRDFGYGNLSYLISPLNRCAGVIFKTGQVFGGSHNNTMGAIGRDSLITMRFDSDKNVLSIETENTQSISFDVFELDGRKYYECVLWVGIGGGLNDCITIANY
eukprot:UN07876